MGGQPYCPAIKDRWRKLYSLLNRPANADGVPGQGDHSLSRTLWRVVICQFGDRTVPLSKADKQAVVAEVSSVLAQAQTMVLAEYRGVAVDELTQLRNKARAQHVALRVLKNTLARRAVENTPFAPLAEQMVGPLIYSISKDHVAVAKVVNDFDKSNDTFVIRTGMNEGKVMDLPSNQTLANIPGREELLARLLGVMLAPVSGFARALAALSAQQGEQTVQNIFQRLARCRFAVAV